MLERTSFGTVCGTCRSYNELSAAQCRDCGAPLLLSGALLSGSTAEGAPATLGRALQTLVPKSASPYPTSGTAEPPPAEQRSGAAAPAPPAAPRAQTPEPEPVLLQPNAAKAAAPAAAAAPEPRSGPSALPSGRAAQIGPPEPERRSGTHAYCPVCHSEVVLGSAACATCGARLPQSNAQSSAVSPGLSPYARLVVVEEEGTDGASFLLAPGEQVLGRSEGLLRFPEDEHLSPRHARFYFRSNRLYVRDDESLNGVFVRIRGPVELHDGDTFFAGQELLRFERFETPVQVPEADGTYFYGSPAPQGGFRLQQMLDSREEGLVFTARGSAVVIGRENADIEFPMDPFISRHHTRVERSRGGFLLADLGSRNGTFVRVREERELQQGDFLFMGSTLLRVDLRRP